MLQNTIVVKILFVIIVLLQIVLLFTRKKNKHSYKINQSKRVINKLKTFSGEFKNQQILTYLRKINTYTFEELLLSCFEQQGFKIIRNKKYSGDGGLDGTVYLHHKKYFIQAKRYSGQIKLSHVKAFESLVMNKQAKGLFIHTGATSKSILDQYQKNSHITIISGQKLIDFIISNKLHIKEMEHFQNHKQI